MVAGFAQFNIILICKSLYIFCWKYVISLDDLFFATYLSLVNIIFSLLYAFLTLGVGCNKGIMSYQVIGQSETNASTLLAPPRLYAT